MGRNGLESAKRIADGKEAVDLFVNRFRSSRGSLVIRDALVVGENHGCPHVGGEHFVDGRPAPLFVVLSQGDLNCTEQVVAEHRDEGVSGGSPSSLSG